MARSSRGRNPDRSKGEINIFEDMTAHERREVERYLTRCAERGEDPSDRVRELLEKYVNEHSVW